MYVRLGFSVAVHMRPDVLLVDEVIAVGDEDFQRKCFDHLYALRKSGRTIVIVSHATSLLASLCDEVAWLDHGTLMGKGPASDVIDSYLGSVNAIEGSAPTPARITPDDDAHRSGSGQVRLSSVEILGADGSPAAACVSGDPLRLRLAFYAHEHVEDPVFAVAIRHESGAVVSVVSTRATADQVPPVQGTGRIDYVQDPCRLNPGNYQVDVSVLDRSGTHAFDAWTDALDLVIRQGRGIARGGLVSLPDGFDTSATVADPDDHSLRPHDVPQVTEDVPEDVPAVPAIVRPPSRVAASAALAARSISPPHQRTEKETTTLTGSTARTVRDLLIENAAALNVIRLGLALLVLVSHTYPVGGFGTDPAWPTLQPSTTLGGFAVGAFFALSGLLVTMSGLRRTPYEFIRSRFLRVVPAYVAVVVLGAFALSPVIWWLDNGTLAGFLNLSGTGPVAYVVRNLGFPVGLQYTVNDVFATTTPYGELTGASAINGSLWTLPFELRCYVVALFVVMIGRALGTAKVAMGALGFVSLVLFVGHFDPEMGAAVTPAWMVAPLPELLFVFLCGAVLGSVAHRLPAAPMLVAGALAVYVATSVAGGLWFRTFGLGSLALLLPVLAVYIPRRGLGFFRNDLSYGTYVWAFPVQQTFAYFELNSSKALYMALSTVATLGLAALSWFYVERPALRLRHRAAAVPQRDKDLQQPEIATTFAPSDTRPGDQPEGIGPDHGSNGHDGSVLTPAARGDDVASRAEPRADRVH